jgi:hypothetical protein
VLSLRFENPVNGRTETVGPAPYFRFVGGSLRRGPDDAEVARYNQGMWMRDTESYVAITSDVAVKVHFNGGDTDCAETHGPFDTLRLVDGVMRPGPEYKGELAKLQRGTDTWLVCQHNKNCSTATVLPVSRSST